MATLYSPIHSDLRSIDQQINRFIGMAIELKKESKSNTESENRIVEFRSAGGGAPVRGEMFEISNIPAYWEICASVQNADEYSQVVFSIYPTQISFSYVRASDQDAATANVFAIIATRSGSKCENMLKRALACVI